MTSTPSPDEMSKLDLMTGWNEANKRIRSLLVERNAQALLLSQKESENERLRRHQGVQFESWSDALSRAETELSEARAEVADLKLSVITFCAPWAATYARDFGLPKDHLHPTHYDILARCGARMDDFTRASDSVLAAIQGDSHA